MAFDSMSRFQLTPTVLQPGPDDVPVEVPGPWVRPRFLDVRPPDAMIGRWPVVSGEEGRPHLIAESVYGTQYLDWVLIAFNNATDVLNWPVAGSIIEFPAPALVFAEIG